MNQQTPATSASRKPTPPAWGSRRPQHGFTLIELLVVIGIILILMGLFFAGGKAIMSQAKARGTQTMLESCKTMFENYRNATHLSRPPALLQVPGLTTMGWCNRSGIGTPTRFWTRAQVDAPDPSQLPDLSKSSHTYQLPSATNTIDPAFLNTICVMYTLESIPENKAIINNIPANNILNVVFTNTSNVQVSVPIILDGWGNPILFVPGGGFGASTVNASSGTFPFSAPAVVYLDNTTYGVVTSAGVVTAISSFLTAPPTNSPVLLATFDANNLPANTVYTCQPFFVSAGPDGSFSNVSNAVDPTSRTPLQSDDNVYSFK